MAVEASDIPHFANAPLVAAEADRRDFIHGALAAIAAAGAGLPGWEALLAADKNTAPFIGKARFAVLDAVAESIVPRTDTPGARDALVPQRFDLLMKTWASAKTRAGFQRVLDEIDLAARPRGPGGIASLSPAQQLEVVAAYDKAKMADPDYGKFKALILALYYMSEPGATQELRYEHTPGAWEPSLPVTADTRGWAFDIQI